MYVSRANWTARKPSSHLFRLAVLSLTALSLVGCAQVAERSREDREERPFFQAEAETETHGRKTWFDDLVESDPGRLDVTIAQDYVEHAPAVVAVLPFCDAGSANFTIDKVPITFRNKRERNQWAWTDSQRLRRAIVGYLAEREFIVVNPIAIDAVLQRRKIDNTKKLRQQDPIELGHLFGADAVIYGQVDNYEGYYFALMSAYRVDVSFFMVSTHNGEVLMRASGSRYSVDVSPAFSPQDFAINSALTLLHFRDVTLARAEEEVSRELVLRIPVAPKLKGELAFRALERAEEAEDESESAAPDGVREAWPTMPAPESVPGSSAAAKAAPQNPP